MFRYRLSDTERIVGQIAAIAREPSLREGKNFVTGPRICLCDRLHAISAGAVFELFVNQGQDVVQPVHGRKVVAHFMLFPALAARANWVSRAPFPARS